MLLSIHDLTRRSTLRSCVCSIVTLSFNSRPHKEVDRFSIVNFCVSSPFNSRPHKEVDQKVLWLCVRLEPFNSRPHKEVDIALYTRGNWKRDFQFTTSQGGRLHRANRVWKKCVLSIHDLTRRSTVSTPGNRRLIKSFNSRPHKEVDDRWALTLLRHTTFNSRPHKEVDKTLPHE